MKIQITFFTIHINLRKRTIYNKCFETQDYPSMASYTGSNVIYTVKSYIYPELFLVVFAITVTYVNEIMQHYLPQCMYLF